MLPIGSSTIQLPPRPSPLSPGRTAITRLPLLVVGNEAVGSIALSDHLSASHSIEQTATLNAARERMRSLQYGIVVTDMTLPDGDAVDVCAAAKAVSQALVVLVIASEVA